MKKIMTILLMGALSMALLAGCGKGKEDSTVGESAVTEEDSSKETASQAETEVETEAESEEEQMVGLANSWRDLETLEEAEQLAGFTIENLPLVEGYDQLVYRVMPGAMLEIIYKDADGNEGLRIRKAPGDEDISGVYDELPVTLLYDYEIPYTPMINGNDERMYVATWTAEENGEPYSYSVVLDEIELTEDEFLNLVKKMCS